MVISGWIIIIIAPDTLKHIFYHLFTMRFSQDSAMEERAMFIRDQEGFRTKDTGIKTVRIWLSIN